MTAMLLDSLGRVLLTVGKIALIIVPLTVGYQLLRDNRWLSRRASPYGTAFRRLGLGQGALVPLLAGLVLGIVYGAGVLIQESRSGQMSSREVFLLSLFLCTCHAVVEDTLLFVVVGGDALWILGPRILLAVAATAVLARVLPAERG
ncbi:MAG: nucleoside recognition protein [Thermodesulfobacteriota bacterium]